MKEKLDQSSTNSNKLKEEIKRKFDAKKKEKFKFLICLLISNFFLFILMTDKKSTSIEVSAKKMKKHENYVEIIVPLTLLINITDFNSNEIPITLVKKDNQILSHKAYFFDHVETKDDFNYYKIEVHNKDVSKLTNSYNDVIYAIPYVQRPSPIKKKESSYEIVF